MEETLIVLTGGAGFIGSCFLWKLNCHGISNILVVDHLDMSNKWRNLLGKKFCDYLQRDDFLSRLEGNKLPKITHIVHMGACSSTLTTDADHLIKNNYEYSKRLATWATTKRIPFLYASSAATYGDGAFGYDDAHDAIIHLKPLNIYGYSKHLFDLWVLTNGLIDMVTGLKFFNVFGPNECHKGDMRSVICKAFKPLKQSGTMQLFRSYRSDYGVGEQKRDFVYVKDAVGVMYYFFLNPAKTGIYNLGTGTARSWNDLSRALFHVLGIAPRIEYIDMPDAIRRKYQYFTEAKLDKLRDSGCDVHFRSLEDAVGDYAPYLEHEQHL
jgi:ADP-L-glycero-D-manno-heptose 6-epimerase